MINGGPSDFFILNGYGHKCHCGEKWYDTDGGPCHYVCGFCGKLVDAEEYCGCELSQPSSEAE
jgi:hypothetical protein